MQMLKSSDARCIRRSRFQHGQASAEDQAQAPELQARQPRRSDPAGFAPQRRRQCLARQATLALRIKQQARRAMQFAGMTSTAKIHHP